MKGNIIRSLCWVFLLASPGIWAQSLTVAIKDTSVAKGAAFCTDIKVTNFTNLLGVELSLNYNPNKLTFSRVEGFYPGLASLSAGAFNNIVASNNSTAKIKMVWFDDQLKGVTIPAGSALFRACFTASSTDAQDTLRINETEVINLAETTVPVVANSPVIVIGAGGSGGGSTGGGGTGGGGTGGGGTGGGGTTSGSFKFTIGNAAVGFESEVCVPVTVEGYRDIIGLGIRINYDSTKLRYKSVRNFNTTLSVGGFEAAAFGTPGVGQNKAGTILLSWNDSRDQKSTLTDGTTLFEMCFTGLDSSGTTSLSIPTTGEVINASLQLLTYTTQSGIIALGKPGSGGSVTGPTFRITGGNVEANEPICVDVSTSNFTKIASAQFSFTYDAAQLRFDSVTRFGLTGLVSSSFGLPGQGTTPAGTLRVTWTSPDARGITLSGTPNLFKACFTAIGSGTVPLRFNKSVFEVRDSAQRVLTPGFTDGEVFIQGVINTTDFTIRIGDVTGVVGDKVCMPVSVLNFKDILGMEFTLLYDPVRLKLDTVSDFNLTGLNDSQFGLPGTGTNVAGKVKLSWLDPNVAGVTVANNTIIFKLCFTILSENGSSRVTHDASATTEILNKNEAGVPYQFIPGTVRAGNLIAPVISGSTVRAAACFDASTGGVTLNVSEGTGTFTFRWSNGATSRNLDNVPKGTYSVTVTNVGNPLSASATFVVPGPEAALISRVSKTDAGCSNQTLGSLTAVVSGGRIPYTYAWSGDLAPSPNLKNVPLGSYTLTVTDSLGCVVVSAPQVIAQSNLGLAVQKTDAVCLGKNTGTITLSPSGGMLPYTYTWDNNLAAQAAHTGLAPGNYNVTLTDSTGCQLYRTVTVGQTEGIAISSVQPTYVSSSRDGAIDLTVTGTKGTPVYAWTGPGGYTASTRNISSLDTGTYCLVVRDTTQCRAEICVRIVSRLQFSAPVSVNPCEGSNTGSITISLSGGVAPIAYRWSNGRTTQNLTQLGPGVYSVTATDAQNASLTLAVTLTEQSKPRVTPTITHVSGSLANNNGQISLSVIGGTPPYTFLWDNQDTTATLVNLVTGRYCAQIKDKSSCAVDTCMIIEYRAIPLTVEVIPTGVLCPGDSTGKARVIIRGGTSPYRLILTTLGRTINSANGIVTLENLRGGQFSYAVEDSIRTRWEGFFIVSSPTPFTIEPTVRHDNEESGCTGRILLSISGGTAAYNVLWNTNNTGLQIVSLCEGSYTPTIRDANNCQFVGAPIFVNTFSARPTISKSDCPEDRNGSVLLDVQGGKTPYAFRWVNSRGDTISQSKDLVEVMSGIYTVVIREASGNELVRTYNIEAKNILTATLKANTDFNGFVVSCPEGKDGVLEVSARNNSGSTSFVYEWVREGVLAGSSAVLTSAAPGKYMVKVTDPLGCTITREIEATAPARVAINASVIDIGCPGARTGSIVVSASGGVPGSTYVYVWNNGVRGPSLNLIPQGTYALSVEDRNNCKYTQTYTLRDPAPMVVTLKSSPTLDDKNCDGKISARVTGGFPPYFYTWPQVPGKKDSFLLNLCPGVYGLQVTDSRGCAPTPAVSVVEVNDERFECLTYRKLITPDGDGLNELFIINCVTFDPKYQDNHLRIFNRWGQLVLDQKNYRNDWKGTSPAGDLLPQGVYYFVLDFKGNKPLEGSVTLLREN